METIKLMINGLPGSMARCAAVSALSDDRFELIPESLTGPEILEKSVDIESVTVRLIPPEEHNAAVQRIKAQNDGFIIIDYTHPAAVNSNVALYCRHSIFFVLGTTGGDRDLMMETVKNSSVSAVIAPNMAKQIVGFQAMMEYGAKMFPGIFKGYWLRVKESHQAGKADTSGTAKAIVDSFNAMGIQFKPEEIEKERDSEKQRTEWGIPEEFLGGHGWHTYTLVSGDGTVKFEFTHNVNGRDVYASGTMDAAAFLHEKMKDGKRGVVYSMIDVLRSGTVYDPTR